MEIQHINWVDYGILSLIGISTIISLWRGFVREAMSLVIWVVAFLCAFFFFIPLSSFLFSSITVIILRFALSFLLIFLSVLILGGLLSYFIGRIIKFTGFGSTDRIIGFLFGLARGAIVVVVAIIVLSPTPLSKDKLWQQSLLIPHFQPLAEPLAAWSSDISIRVRDWLKERVPEDLFKKMQISI